VWPEILDNTATNVTALDEISNRIPLHTVHELDLAGKQERACERFATSAAHDVVHEALLMIASAIQHVIAAYSRRRRRRSQAF
jgi:hypothetical protein